MFLLSHSTLDSLYSTFKVTDRDENFVTNKLVSCVNVSLPLLYNCIHVHPALSILRVRETWVKYSVKVTMIKLIEIVKINT